MLWSGTAQRPRRDPRCRLSEPSLYAFSPDPSEPPWPLQRRAEAFPKSSPALHRVVPSWCIGFADPSHGLASRIVIERRAGETVVVCVGGAAFASATRLREQGELVGTSGVPEL